MIEHGTEDAALGCFHLATYDPADDEYDIPDEFLCIVNVRTNLDVIRDEGSDRAAMESAVTTAPHEVMHALQFALDHGGRIPVQVFDADSGAFLRMTRQNRDDDQKEDEAEQFERTVT